VSRAAARRGPGPLVLLGGGEWTEPCRELDAELLAGVPGAEVVVLPAAAAFAPPERVADRARSWYGSLGATARTLPILHRTEAEDHELAAIVRKARFLVIPDGSPLHLRSVLKGSAVFDALESAYRSGAVVVASGAGATVVCDPMVDPRGGAYTVGLGLVSNLAVFPYHGTAADHMRERSIDLVPRSATLVGVDEATALVHEPDGEWRVAGPGAVSVYENGAACAYRAPSRVPLRAV
jgi:cyanophycinase